MVHLAHPQVRSRTGSAGRRAALLAASGIAIVPISALLVNGLGLPSWLGALGLVGVLLVVAGGAVAAHAAIRRGDRSPLTLLVLVAGALALTFVIGELVSPH